MVVIEVSVDIGAPPPQVWAAVADIASHVRWMDDARAIRFEGAQRTGAGTRFACDTRIGPVRLTDHMEVVTWEPPRQMAVRHRLPVEGTGRFTIAPSGGGSLFTWREELSFPWWLGGRLGSRAAAPVMRRVWRRNLANLRALVEGAGDDPGQVGGFDAT